ncbi:uncharacterized protein [Hoplias malabaricus]|uniref:uncharacterized protein n=1 Tax=Hoplias malabaricus TaxID=27720 RepID=UPI003462A499
MKYFMTARGQTFTSHLTFLERLSNRLRLREVNSLDESDIVISFVPVVSRAGTDIEAALQAIPQTTKPVVLVVLHHTFDPHFITPESRLSVNRENVFTVDCLFHEDRGLLRCQRNDEALRVVTDYLTAKGASPTSQEGSRKMKYFMTAHGQTFTSHLTFLERLSNRLRLREVNSLDESDIVISFVAIVSRAGTDIEAALQAIPQRTKPVVLVVLHHTFDPGFIIVDSSLSVNRENVFIVDCLFHEDKGLLRCQRNDEALRAVTDYLKAKGASPTSQEGVRPVTAQVYLTAFCQHLRHLFLTNKKIIFLIVLWIVLGMASGAVIYLFFLGLWDWLRGACWWTDRSISWVHCSPLSSK